MSRAEKDANRIERKLTNRILREAEAKGTQPKPAGDTLSPSIKGDAERWGVGESQVNMMKSMNEQQVRERFGNKAVEFWKKYISK